MNTVDGFPLRKNTNKLPPNDLTLNTWSHWQTVTVIVMDFYINMREVSWKGQVVTVEIDLFKGLVAQMMEGDTSVLPQFRKRKSKEEVLDLIFEMFKWGE